MSALSYKFTETPNFPHCPLFVLLEAARRGRGSATKGAGRLWDELRDPGQRPDLWSLGFLIHTNSGYEDVCFAMVVFRIKLDDAHKINVTDLARRVLSKGSLFPSVTDRRILSIIE